MQKYTFIYFFSHFLYEESWRPSNIWNIRQATGITRSEFKNSDITVFLTLIRIKKVGMALFTYEWKITEIVFPKYPSLWCTSGKKVMWPRRSPQYYWNIWMAFTPQKTKSNYFYTQLSVVFLLNLSDSHISCLLL